MNRANEYPHEVYCLLRNKIIDCIDCVLTQDVVDRILKETVLHDKSIFPENWRKDCKNCKYFEYE